jgi:hypothetical protein
MPTTVTTVYRVAQGGLSIAALQAAVAAVPVPDAISVYGARVLSDSTAPAAPGVARTIVFSLVPSSTATANASLFPGDASGSPIDAITISGAGADYILPPIVRIAATNPPADLDAKAYAYLKAIGTLIVSGGTGYNPATTTAKVVGGLPSNLPTAVAATVTLTIALGVVTAAAFTPGSGYTSVPKIVIVDTSGAGSGARITLRMGVDFIDLAFAGQGYESAPAITLAPAFSVMFAANAGGPFDCLMNTAIERAVLSPVTADAPIVA